jgi:uncharacterized protein
VTAGKLRLSRPPLAPEKLGWFRWGRVAGKVLLTNDVGEWLFLEEADFRSFLAGGLPAEHPKYAGLQERGFLRDNLDAEELARRLRKKKRFLGQGPHLAIVITTLRCNQSCRYCHASRTDMERVDTDMSLATARKVVDHALQTPSPYLCFEYQGGEPTVNFDALRFCVEYSREKNRVEKKSLDHSLVTNMTWMNEERAEWLLQNGVLLCTSLDGPESVHNQNRPWTGNKAAAFETVIGWMKHINRRYVELGRDPELWHVDALSTTTRASLSAGRELVDLYVEMGIRNVHLRPLNPFGFATKTWKAIGYTMEEWLDWYRATLDYIIELNLQGVQIMEGTAALFLKKILTPEDPNFVDLRSPVGSGSGQITYGYDGTIYPSDEGRMVAAMGDPIFALGHVDSLSMAEALRHPTVRALAASSLLDALPQCVDCWNAPYCGVRPEHNYMMDGDLFSQRPLTPKHTQHLAIATYLFEKLAHDSDGRIETIFRRWTVDRPRDA